MNIQRLTVEEAQHYISCKDDLMGYPAEYYTLVPSGDGKWDDVTYYTGRKKIGINRSGEGKYWIYVLSNGTASSNISFINAFNSSICSGVIFTSRL